MHMRTVLSLAFILVFQFGHTQAPDPAVLVGEWQVDLRPKPDAEPYFQKLIVTEVNDSSFTGTFYYDSEIQEARFNVDWGGLTIAFVT